MTNERPDAATGQGDPLGPSLFSAGLRFDPTRTSSLLRAAQDGSRLAVERLFSRYAERVEQMVALRLGVRRSDMQAGQDLVQEALLSAFRSLDAFEPRSEGSFRNWLASIVANRIRDDFRRCEALKRRGGQAGDDLTLEESGSIGHASREPSPSEQAMASELALRIEGALLTLGERSRRVFELRRLAEMSYEEVAEEMGLSGAASARALFARTLRKIADLVGELE